MNYLAGFCPDGQSCKYMHPRFELPAPPEQTKDQKRLPVCHYCSEVGHKASSCNKIPPDVRNEPFLYIALDYFCRLLHDYVFLLFNPKTPCYLRECFVLLSDSQTYFILLLMTLTLLPYAYLYSYIYFIYNICMNTHL